MNVFRFAKATLIALSCAAFITACKGPDASAPEASSPEAAPKAAAPVPAEDPNAINQPIPADAYKVTLALSGDPVLADDGKSITYQVEVKNEGTVPVYGVGSKAVNIGMIALGDDNKVNGPGSVRDFSRTHLPLIAPGQSSLVAVVVPADARLAGRSLRLATVQEGVAWHEDDGTIDLGPFQIDGKTFASLPASK